jgi:hypothetical protein
MSWTPIERPKGKIPKEKMSKKNYRKKKYRSEKILKIPTRKTFFIFGIILTL